MNQRIQELAIDAGIVSAEYNGFDPTGLTKAQRKFAELIVRECAEVARLNTRVDSKVYLIIQEHFGIKK